MLPKASALGQPRGIGCGGRWVQDGVIHVFLWPIRVDVWQKTSQYCKVTILQLKQIFLKIILKKKTIFSHKQFEDAYSNTNIFSFKPHYSNYYSLHPISTKSEP